MKEMNSNQLGVEPIVFGEQTAMLNIYDGLATPFSDDTIILSEEHAQTITRFVTSAVEAYGDNQGVAETTYAYALGVPSLLVRVDCTVRNGKLVPYEMEDSPSGIGVSDKLIYAASGKSLKDAVLNHYEVTAGTIPHVIISGARKHGTDDAAIVGEHRYHYEAGKTTLPKLNDTSLVIVKAIPGQSNSALPYLSLQERCLSPLMTEGNKTYAKRIGIASSVETEDELLTNDDGSLASQAVKAAIGSMSMGVSIYLTSEERKVFGKDGSVSTGRLIRNLARYTENGQAALTEPFHPPIQIINTQNRRNAIMRIFVALQRSNVTTRVETNILGGAYVARPELIVHGASNAISGAVLVK